MKIYTIGFTKKTAEDFFNLLQENRVRKIIDTRLNNSSQLAGFAKGKDLAYFARELLGIDYEYQKSYAPTKELLSNYRKGSISWEDYAVEYLAILRERNIIEKLDISQLDGACLLCSEHEPDQCHRRLLAEYFQKIYSDIEIIHLK